jgi:ribosomal protein S17E
MYINRSILDASLDSLVPKDLDDAEVIEKAALDILNKSALFNPFLFNEELTKAANKLIAATLKSDYGNSSDFHKFSANDKVVESVIETTLKSLKTTISLYLEAKSSSHE